jgi:hypothetical protein
VTAAAARVPLLVRALREPACLVGVSTADWELLIRQARSADLMARLALRLQGTPAVSVPPPAQAHLQAGLVLARAQAAEVERELDHIERALMPLGVAPVLLKGAAYVAAGLPAAHGRVFNDIDLMLPMALLPRAEAQLMLHGWATTHHDAYDQRYYRQWMHELPPLRHVQRQSVLDVHHAILPQTARLRPDSGKLFDAAVPAALRPGFRVLAPVDMVLHSICHLMHNEIVRHALRDLTDIDLLLRHGADQPGFWPEVTRRARELDLARPLYYALHHARNLLGTPVPQAALAEAASAAPGPLTGALTHRLWQHAWRAAHPSMGGPGTAPARMLLYVRAHWLRMPPALLLRHLFVKATGLHKTDKK